MRPKLVQWSTCWYFLASLRFCPVFELLQSLPTFDIRPYLLCFGWQTPDSWIIGGCHCSVSWLSTLCNDTETLVSPIHKIYLVLCLQSLCVLLELGICLQCYGLVPFKWKETGVVFQSPSAPSKSTSNLVCNFQFFGEEDSYTDIHIWHLRWGPLAVLLIAHCWFPVLYYWLPLGFFHLWTWSDC